MLDAIPSPVTPRPFASLEAKHERHNEAEHRNECQQCDVSVVADTPNPVEQKCAPVPAVDFRRDGFWFDTKTCVTHDHVLPLRLLRYAAAIGAASHRALIICHTRGGVAGMSICRAPFL